MIADKIPKIKIIVEPRKAAEILPYLSDKKPDKMFPTKIPKSITVPKIPVCNVLNCQASVSLSLIREMTPNWAPSSKIIIDCAKTANHWNIPKPLLSKILFI